MGLRPVGAYGLSDLKLPEMDDQRRPHEETDHQTGEDGTRGPEGNILEQIERSDNVVQRIQQMVKHEIPLFQGEKAADGFFCADIIHLKDY
jgi:hypothetical protein